MRIVLNTRLTEAECKTVIDKHNAQIQSQSFKLYNALLHPESASVMQKAGIAGLRKILAGFNRMGSFVSFDMLLPHMKEFAEVNTATFKGYASGRVELDINDNWYMFNTIAPGSRLLKDIEHDLKGKIIVLEDKNEKEMLESFKERV